MQDIKWRDDADDPTRFITYIIRLGKKSPVCVQTLAEAPKSVYDSEQAEG